MKTKPHRWHFVPVEDERHAAAAVVQVAAVGLALGGGGLPRRGSGHGAHPPVVAGRGETRQVNVLQARLAGRARLPPLVPSRWAEPAGTTAAHHLEAEEWPTRLKRISHRESHFFKIPECETEEASSRRATKIFAVSKFLPGRSSATRPRLKVRSRRNAAALLLDGLFYLCALHFAVGAAAAVALLFPAAAVGKLKPGIVASLSDADD